MRSTGPRHDDQGLDDKGRHEGGDGDTRQPQMLDQQDGQREVDQRRPPHGPGDKAVMARHAEDVRRIQLNAGEEHGDQEDAEQRRRVSELVPHPQHQDGVGVEVEQGDERYRDGHEKAGAVDQHSPDRRLVTGPLGLGDERHEGVGELLVQQVGVLADLGGDRIQRHGGQGQEGLDDDRVDAQDHQNCNIGNEEEERVPTELPHPLTPEMRGRQGQVRRQAIGEDQQHQRGEQHRGGRRGGQPEQAVAGLQQDDDERRVDERGHELDGVDQGHAPAAHQDRLEKAQREADRDGAAEQPQCGGEPHALALGQIKPARGLPREHGHQRQADQPERRVDDQQRREHLVPTGGVSARRELGDIFHGRRGETQVQQTEQPDDRKDQRPEAEQVDSDLRHDVGREKEHHHHADQEAQVVAGDVDHPSHTGARRYCRSATRQTRRASGGRHP